ncbi:hypothetical protein BZM27_55290 [Paraburkholderia steynii]|uniref:Uncharacterized protein n=1 Tax=Paraburkholderia steynii TaxID=1245441 RepID=A0A4R0WUR3_9BURK|nr:hypothetical protein BZM27_55290 [Paraburkholderia steynii]
MAGQLQFRASLLGATGGLTEHTIKGVLDNESGEVTSENVLRGGITRIVEDRETSLFELDKIVRDDVSSAERGGQPAVN